MPQQIGQRCEFCGSTALVPYEEVKEPFRPESLLPLKISESQARDLIRAWYGRQWLAPNKFSAQGAHRHGQGHLPSLLDVRREGRRALDRRGGQVLLRPAGRQERAPGAVDAGVRRAVARVRRRAGVRVGGRGCGPAAEHRAVSDGLAGAVRSRLSGGLDRRALPDRSRRGGRAFAAADGRHAARAVRPSRCPATRYRNLVVDATFTDQTFKHILAPVWLLTYVYGAKLLPGGRERRHRAHRRFAAVELDQGRRCSCWRR